MNMEETILKKPLLLLIEDNPDTQQIYKDVFEREGFQVLTGSDGEMGLRYAQSTSPDVILLDLMLPKLKGFDLLKRLRAHEETRRIPVAIFSALADPSDRKIAADLGVTEYAVKSMNTPKQIVCRVRALLARGECPDGSNSTTVAVKESLFDAPRLQAESGLSNGFHCPQCHAEVVLVMLPDPTRRPGHWYAAHLSCSLCQRAF